ncbi:MAG: ABC transporter permease [Acidobacteriota bacterium]
MKRLDIVRRAARNLRQAKGRTLLTALAIAVGAFTIMMSLAAGAGTREYTRNLIESNADPQTMLVTKRSNTGDGSLVMTQRGLREYGQNVDAATGVEMIDQHDIDVLEKRSDVDWVIPYYQIKVNWATFEGVDKKYSMDAALYDPYIKGSVAVGTLPARGKAIERNEIVMPEDFATFLHKRPEELVGKKVTLNVSSQAKQLSESEIRQLFMTGGSAAVETAMRGETKEIVLTIRAFTKSNTSSKMVSSTGSAAQINEGLAREISELTTKGTDQYQRYYTATVRIKDGTKPSDLKDSFKQSGYTVMTVEDMQTMLFQFVNVLQYIVAGFGVLALIASVFGIVNTQYISVLERTSQIGLMKALGMPNRGIGKLFRYEAAWIGFLGGIIGIGLAWLAVYLLNPWITSTLGLGEGNYLLRFEWLSALVLLLGLIVTAITAGWLPSRKAAKLDPIEALRTE